MLHFEDKDKKVVDLGLDLDELLLWMFDGKIDYWEHDRVMNVELGIGLFLVVVVEEEERRIGKVEEVVGMGNKHRVVWMVLGWKDNDSRMNSS